MSKQTADIIVPNEQIIISEEEQNIISKHKKMSNRVTPKPYISQKAGFDYVDEGYMRYMLNQYYPVWSWEIMKYEFVGDKYISVHGRLTISDEGLTRYFESTAAHRIQTNKKSGEYVDIGNDMKSANSDAFKVAVNRLCNVADDVYRKQVKDYSLSQEDHDVIGEIINKLNQTPGNTQVVDKIYAALKDGRIDKSNMDAYIRRAKQIIESKGDTNE